MVPPSFVRRLHGFETHGLVHEAGHSAAAIERGIDFVDVALFTPDLWHETSDGTVAGGARLAIDLRDVAPALPRATLEFALAGVQSERILLGHELSRSYLGDVNMWRRAIGVTASQQLGEMERLIGSRLQDVVNDVETWVVSRQVGIAAVAKGMQESRGRLTQQQAMSLL